MRGRDAAGHLWAFLDEAAHPDAIRPGNLVVTGDQEDPVVARVLEIIDRPGGQKVVMQLLGDADELLATLTRARVVAV